MSTNTITEAVIEDSEYTNNTMDPYNNNMMIDNDDMIPLPINTPRNNYNRSNPISPSILSTTSSTLLPTTSTTSTTTTSNSTINMYQPQTSISIHLPVPSTLTTNARAISSSSSTSTSSQHREYLTSSYTNSIHITPNSVIYNIMDPTYTDTFLEYLKLFNRYERINRGKTPISPLLCDLIAKLLRINPSYRPIDVDTILNHPWFNEE